MYQDKKIWVGCAGDKKVYIYPKMANRHGLIAGATGTGKTVTLKVACRVFQRLRRTCIFSRCKGRPRRHVPSG